MENKEIRSMGTTWQKWKYTTLVLSKENIEDFETLAHRRILRNANVTKLRRLLERGKHFETPFVCNKARNKWRLLDGNHRHEALRQFFKEYPDRRVETAICYYEELDENGEREIYTLWNLGTKQTTNDFIKQYWDQIPIAAMIEKSFPWKVGPYPMLNGVEFKLFIAPYLAKDNVSITLRGPAADFVQRASLLDYKDYNVLREFANEFIRIFGKPERINPSYRPTCFSVIENIWLQNRLKINPEKMNKRLAKLRGCERLMFWSGQNGDSSRQQCRKDFVGILNRGSSRELFV